MTGVIYQSSGGVNCTVSIRSDGVYSAAAGAYAAGGDAFALPVAYVAGVPIELLWATDEGGSVSMATIDSALVPAEGGVVAEIDTVAGTASLRPVDIDEFAALSGYTVESLPDLQERFETGMHVDRTSATPELFKPEVRRA